MIPSGVAPPPSRLIRVLGAFVVANLFLCAGVDRSRDTLYIAQRAYFSTQSQDDSWKPMVMALNHIKQYPDKPLYKTLFFEGRVKFQYPTSSLLLLDFLKENFGDETAVNIGKASSRLVTFATLLISLWMLVQRAIRLRLVPPKSLPLLGLCGIAALLALAFVPIGLPVALGQIQPWVTFFSVLTAAAIYFELPLLAGAACAMACAIKPQLGLFLLWFASRRQFRALLSMLTLLVFIEGAAILRYGWANQMDYLNVLSFLSRHGESYFANQSVNGLLNRMLHLGVNVNFQPDAFPRFSPWVYFPTVFSSLVLMGFALFWRRPKGPAVILEDYLIAALTFTMASPIAWEHHYGVTFFMFAFLFPAVWLRGGRLLICFALSYSCLANRLLVVNRLSDTPLNFLQSYMLFGAIILLVILYRIRDSQAPPINEHPSLASVPA